MRSLASRDGNRSRVVFFNARRWTKAAACFFFCPRQKADPGMYDVKTGLAYKAQQALNVVLSSAFIFTERYQHTPS